MFHSQYDYDTTIFTIDGKILQIEYAKNAAKNGQLGIGVRSSNHLVLFSNNNKNKEFVQKTNKLFSISPNTGMMVSGVIGDSKIVFQFIEKKNEQYIFMNKTNCPTPLLTSKCSAFFSPEHFTCRSSSTRCFYFDFRLRFKRTIFIQNFK
mmetsp:Transcript_40725/g.83292  ORF Transcript_40725/g.83292 Transcript_40725/m.83292 type:complete len:150 (+) Transcript_40725:1437-1886(+)